MLEGSDELDNKMLYLLAFSGVQLMQGRISK